jgi:hypothetical protein
MSIGCTATCFSPVSVAELRTVQRQRYMSDEPDALPEIKLFIVAVHYIVG